MKQKIRYSKRPFPHSLAMYSGIFILPEYQNLKSFEENHNLAIAILTDKIYLLIPGYQQVCMDNKSRISHGTMANYDRTCSLSQSKILTQRFQVYIPTIGVNGVYLMVILIFSLITSVETISSTPIPAAPVAPVAPLVTHDQIESIWVDVYPVAGSWSSTQTVNFQKAKATLPVDRYVFVSMGKMDYIMNDISFSSFVLYFDITYSVQQTYIDITVSNLNDRMILTTISVMIFSNQFIGLSMIDSFQNQFNDPGSMTYQFGLLQTQYVVLKFIKQIDLSTPPHEQLHEITFTDSVASSIFQTTVSYIGNYNYAWTYVKFLVFYPTRATESTMSVFSYTADSTMPPYVIDISFSNFDSALSMYILGFNSFSYGPVVDSSNAGFKWGVNFASDVLLQIQVDDQFSKFKPSFFMINMGGGSGGSGGGSGEGCVQYPHILQGTNRTSTITQCFDECYENEYLDYSVSLQVQICTLCANPLCKTCQTPLNCSSCVSFYDLSEIGSCNLNSGFYIGTNSVILPCHNNLTGCLRCSPDGITCSLCISQYYWDSAGICTACSTISSSCIKCADSMCLQCQLPLVLINQTFCSTPISVPPNPSNPIGLLPCSDLNCLSCPNPNLDYCLLCSSILFSLQNGKCNLICGDGIIAGTELCDDQNNNSFDGCSQDCLTVEQNFFCAAIPSILPGYFKSDCYLNKKIELRVLSIKKAIRQNKLIIIIKNQNPKIHQWKQIDQKNELKSMVDLKIPRFQSGIQGYKFNFTVDFIKSLDEISQIRQKVDKQYKTHPSRLLQASQFDYTGYQYLSLQISYSSSPSSISVQSLNHQQATLSLRPSLSLRRVFSQNAALLDFEASFTLRTDNNFIIQQFDEQYYEHVSQIFTVSCAISLLVIFMMILSAFVYLLDGKNSRQMLITLETAFIVQFTYFSLMAIGQLNPLFMSMAEGLKLSLGLDLPLVGGFASSRDLSGITILSYNLADNVNVSIVLVTLFIFIGLIIFTVDRFTFNKKTDLNQKIEGSPHKSISQEQNQEQSKCRKLSVLMMFNLGFGLFMFFLYKFIICLGIQIKYQTSSFQTLDLIIILTIVAVSIFYILVIHIKFEFFATLTQKIKTSSSKISLFGALTKYTNVSAQKAKKIQSRFEQYVQLLPENDKPQVMKKTEFRGTKLNVKYWYIILVFVWHLLNSCSIIFLSEFIVFHQIVPIFSYFICMIFAFKFNFYSKANLWRLYFTYFVGMCIQIILFVQSVSMQRLTSSVGGQQTGLGLYFPYTILILLFFLCLVSLVYLIYSINRTKCCKLQIQWQKIQLTVAMKMKLRTLVEEQIGFKVSEKQENIAQKDDKSGIQAIKNRNICHFQSLQVANQQELHHSLDDSSDSSFFRKIVMNATPLNQLILASQNNDSDGSPLNYSINRKNKCNKLVQTPLNQLMTAKQLKKQIKQKILTNKMPQNISSLTQKDLKKVKEVKKPQQKGQTLSRAIQNVDFSKKIHWQSHHERSQSPLKNRAKISKQIASSEINIYYIKTQDQQIQNAKDPIGYKYTNAQLYDRFEEFDMI